MRNELGQSAKIVVCPSDERIANQSFSNPWNGKLDPNNIANFNNTNVSYWVGVGANDKYPQSLLGGDRNLGGAGILNGVGNPTANYGFSAVTGTQDDAWLGADVKLGTDGKILEEFNYLGAGVYVSNYCDWSLIETRVIE